MTVDLSVVPTEPEYENRQVTPAHIPAFEGKDVSFTKAKLTSTSNLEVDDQVFRVDEYVRMEIEGRVVDVAHRVNQTTGALERVHTIKAIEATVLPWEEER